MHCSVCSKDHFRNKLTFKKFINIKVRKWLILCLKCTFLGKRTRNSFRVSKHNHAIYSTYRIYDFGRFACQYQSCLKSVYFYKICQDFFLQMSQLLTRFVPALLKKKLHLLWRFARLKTRFAAKSTHQLSLYFFKQ